MCEQCNPILTKNYKRLREPKKSLTRYMSLKRILSFPNEHQHAMSKPSVVCAVERVAHQFCALPSARNAPHVHRVRVLPLVPRAAQKTARGAARRAESQEA